MVLPTTYRQGVSTCSHTFSPEGERSLRNGEYQTMTGYLVSILTFIVLAAMLGLALNIQWVQAGNQVLIAKS